MRTYTYWFDCRWNYDDFVSAYKNIVPKGTTFVEAEDDNEECITESYFGGTHVCHIMTMAEPCPAPAVIANVAHRHGYAIINTICKCHKRGICDIAYIDYLGLCSSVTER